MLLSSCVASIAFTSLLFIDAAVNAASQGVPQAVAWSTKSYGPDGPWQAVTVQVGNPVQSIDLLPGGTWQSNILGSSICADTSVSSVCYAQAAGLYNRSASTTAAALTVQGNSPNTSFDWTHGGRDVVGTVAWVFDRATVPSLFEGARSVTIPDLSLFLISNGYLTLPDGSKYPLEIGTLGLGAPAINQSFSDNGKASFNGSLLPGYLFETGLVGSNSFGLHIGSASLKIPGSLYIGGYDQSRVLGAVTAQSYGVNFLPIDLLDVGIGVAQGKSPFDFASKSGLLAQGNSSIGAAVSVLVDATAPYLYLPQSSCDAIAATLPVTYQKQYGLYFWNTADPTYDQIVSSPSYLSFTFRLNRSNVQNMTINVPFKLLNLTLEAPLVDKPTQYFPCRPQTHDNYILGQAFLQAAFYGANWGTQNDGVWFLAQAPGPNTPTTAVVTSIGASDKSIIASQNQWLESWQGSWTPLESGTIVPQNGNGNSSFTDTTVNNSGLSTGAKAGIGVACAIGGLFTIAAALFFWRRRKRNATFTTTAGATNPDHVDSTGQDIKGQSAFNSAEYGPRELGDEQRKPSELWDSKSTPRAELAGNSPVELSGVNYSRISKN